jgi:hypothetical protein
VVAAYAVRQIETKERNYADRIKARKEAEKAKKAAKVVQMKATKKRHGPKGDGLDSIGFRGTCGIVRPAHKKLVKWRKTYISSLAWFGVQCRPLSLPCQKS